MEPLTGFFILEGLLFDIIGAVFIVTGIVFPQKQFQDITPTIMEEETNIRLLDIQIELFHYQKSLKNQILNSKLTSSHYDDKIITNMLEKLSKHIAYLIIYSVRSLAEKHQNQIKIVQGLPFLIGGFILQGIGVITQL